jgi:formylglycine-generating enzyme
MSYNSDPGRQRGVGCAKSRRSNMMMKPVMLLSLVVGGTLFVGCNSDSSSANSGAGGSATAGGATSSGQSTSKGGGTQTATSTVGGSSNSAGGSSATSSTNNGTGCTGGLEEKNSKGLCVAKMATIQASTDYKIDVTEVTQGQYADWLKTNPSLPLQSDPVCGWKWDASDAQTFNVKGTIYSGDDADHHPVFAVDWCDAKYYCDAVGKRLCGKIGGGSNDYAGFADSDTSQWYRACSSGGVNKYPYGATYKATACNGRETTNGATVLPGSMKDCQSSAAGFTGIYDLVGNIREWEDSCLPLASDDPTDTGVATYCRVRGGDYTSVEKELSCDYEDSTMRYMFGYNAVGFRCCSG